MSDFKPVLLVEDDVSSAFYLEEILSVLGIHVITASTACEAEYAMENHEFSLILMDIRLPDMDGYELTRRIRTKNTKIPIIAQTAFAMANDKNKALDAGCTDYVTKPLRKDTLIQVLHKYLVIEKLKVSLQG